MLRIWVPVAVVSLLAACSGVPPQTASRSSGMTIKTPRAFPPPANFPKFVDHSVGQEEISIQAMSLVGVPYRWGGNTPASGFDCSGLVRYVMDRAADVNLPRTTADMSSRGVSIEPDQIAPGDLIFFNTTGRPHSHVGIYVGKLRFVNAPSTGGTVRLDYLTNPYWAKRFDGIRRVAPPAREADAVRCADVRSAARRVAHAGGRCIGADAGRSRTRRDGRGIAAAGLCGDASTTRIGGTARGRRRGSRARVDCIDCGSRACGSLRAAAGPLVRGPATGSVRGRRRDRRDVEHDAGRHAGSRHADSDDGADRRGSRRIRCRTAGCRRAVAQ